MPTDLLGITPGKYDPNREDKNFEAATGSVCNQIRNQFKKLGCLRVSNENEESDKSSDENKHSDNSWLYDFVKKDFESAKTKLENIMSNESGEDLLVNKAWLVYIDFKTNEKNGLQELYNLAETHKDNLAIQKQISRMLLWEGYTEKAIELVKKALDNHPSNNDLIVLLSDCHKGNDDLDQAMDILSGFAPSENPEIAIELSESYEEINDLNKAISVIHSVFINFPNNESIMYKYSRLLEKNNRNKEALYLLNTLAIECPENHEYWGYLGNCCLDLEMYDKAMMAYKKAEELSESKSSWILHNIGNIMNNKGFHTEGISWLNKGLDLERSSQYAHDRLAKAIKSQEEENKKYKNICKEGRKLIRDFISV
jgi:predicted Zn-dependent protease